MKGRIITESVCLCYLWNNAAVTRTTRNLTYGATAALALLSGALVALSGRDGPAAPEAATVYQAPRPFPAIDLIDHNGDAFGREQLVGRWSWLFFGFTHCPDVCPTTLQLLKQARGTIGDDSALPEVVLISVDPERDTPATLARYVGHFDPEFVGVTGSSEAIDRLTEALYVSYAKVPDDNGGYTVDHSAAVFFVNPRAEVVAVTTPPHAASVLTAWGGVVTATTSARGLTKNTAAL